MNTEINKKRFSFSINDNGIQIYEEGKQIASCEKSNQGAADAASNL